MKRQTGATMIEVLVTILIISAGLLGMAGMQARSHSFEFESYQRAQALIILQDIVSKMNANATYLDVDLTTTIDNLANYVTTGVGSGISDASDCYGSSMTRAQSDLCEWSKSLKGAAELSGSQNAGAMINGHGCIAQVSGTTSYLVSVVWQGMSDTVPPVTDCGNSTSLYPSENRRRAVTAVVAIPDLGAP
ncbi:MAG: type IV pilus modification protein PilV [Rhodocyclaceae bacterium]|nr:type IV pilus modification protein PilV [Rhodocyclaceae bacterium]MDZ4214692.1 type IV pilus modification protein PilV [Rhodocyclaceae bacterium]